MTRADVDVGTLTEDSFAAKMASMPRDTVVIVEDVPELARAVTEHGRRAVLVSETHARADGLTVVSDLFDLEGRFGELGAPEAWVMAHSDEHADRFAAMCDKARLNYKTANVRARAWVEYLLENLPYATQPSLMRLMGKFRGVPAFIVGAGPSLDLNRHELERAAKHGIIIAINGAGRTLPVEPHITLSIEAEDTRALLGDTRGSIRAFALTCHPGVMEHGDGPLSPVYVTNPSGVLKTLTGLPRLETSISASTTGTSLAYILGCSPIVLVGQDMGFPGGRTYTAGIGGGTIDANGVHSWGDLHRNIPRALSQLPERERLTETTAWGGDGTVLTSMPWATMRAYLESCAVVWEDVQLVNCTEGGARAEGWAEAPLGWFVDLLAAEGKTAPSRAALVAMMDAAGPLVRPEQLDEFLAAQAVAARVVSLRATCIRQLCEACASTVGELPKPVRDLLAWVWEPSPWARSWTERMVNEDLAFYERTPPCADLAEERLACAWALGSACAVIETEARSLSDRIQEAT